MQNEEASRLAAESHQQQLEELRRTMSCDYETRLAEVASRHEVELRSVREESHQKVEVCGV